MIHDYRVPIPPEVKTQLNELASHITSKLPEGWGFTLLLFTFGDAPGTMTYISNAQRQDMLKAFQEFLRMQGS